MTLAGLFLVGGILVVLVVGLVSLPAQEVQDADRDARGRVTEASTVDKDALRPGDCVNDAALRDLALGQDMETVSATVDVVPCATLHDFEVTAAFTLPEGDYSDAQDLRRAVNQGCVRRLRQDWARTGGCCATRSSPSTCRRRWRPRRSTPSACSSSPPASR